VGSNTVIDGEKFSSSHAVGNSPSGQMAYTNGPKLANEKYTPASGEHTHAYKQSFVAPTCTTKGYTVNTCSCGIAYKTDYVDALGHDWVEDYVQNNKVFYYCTRCGETKSEPVSGEGEWPFADWEWEVLKLVNKVRAAEGLKPLTGFALLQQVGDIRAEELADVFSHTRPNGSSCFTAMDEVGMPYGAAGENIAAGHNSPENVMWDPTYGWMYSEGHRGNILDPDFQHMGVGYYYDSSSYYRHHWVQTFASMHFESNSGFELVFPNGTEFKAGTAIEEMDIFAKVVNSAYGTCYLPIIAEYCTGYAPGSTKDQTVTVSVLGFTETFLISRGSHTHTYGNWYETQAPTCTAKGQQRRDCTGCEMYETREVAAIGHDYKAVVTAATCTEQGYTTHTCASCKDSYVDSHKEALGHNWNGGVVTKEPTEDTTGIRTFTCTRCDITRTETIPKLDHVHKYTEKVTAPTCTEQGYTTHTCACGESYVDAYVAAKGHTFGRWTVIKAPTCTEKGGEIRKCSKCTHSESREVAATGHKYEKGICTVCGHKDENYVPEVFDLYGSSMTLGNALDMNFFVYQSDIKDTGNYAVITKHYADGRPDAVVTVAQKNWAKLGSVYYYFTFSGVKAKEMADKVEVVIYNAKGEAISEVFTDSVQGYARRMLDNPGTIATHRTLYIEMLNYGAAAQVEFKYDVNNLANSVITAAEQQAYGMKDRTYANQRKSDAAYFGTTLTLENQIVFNIFYNGSYVPEGAYAVATFTNHKGQKMEETVTGFATVASYKYASFKSLVVADCSELITVKLYDTNGKLISTVVDSIEGYAARMTEVGPLYDAIMKFADAAYQYFHS